MKDPSTIQTASGIADISSLPLNFNFSDFEKEILQNLAKRVGELSARPIEDRKKEKWRKHNDLEESYPLIFCDPENGWNEIITQDQLKCKNLIARVWEMSLRKEIFWGEELNDDRVIQPVFNVGYMYSDSGYGLKEIKIGGESGGSFIYDHPIHDYEQDFPGLTYPEISVDRAKTEQLFQLAESIFGDILEVRLSGVWWWSLGMTREFIKLRGLENLMMDMMLYPDGVHRLMDFLCQSYHKRLDFLESNGLLSLNNDGSYVGSGGFGWTNQLPGDAFNPSKVRTMDMWGFTESQETVGVSPEMFAEFILPYQKTINERFGLNCYGCCEPIDPRWEYVKTIPRLRRVSVSPWANISKMKEYLGRDYILSVKPSPTPLASPKMNEETVRNEMKKSLQDSADCFVEFIMKDNHTLGNNPGNAVRWCQIAREEIAKRYGDS